MNKLISTFLLLIAFISVLIGQDSTRIQSQISIESKGAGILVQSDKNIDCLNCHPRIVGDNPIHHYAIYSGITHSLILNQKYTIETGIFLESRSFSGGNNTIKNLVLFPKIKMSVLDSFKLFNKKLTYNIKGGDFWDEDVDDMLRLYNLDYHGLEFSASLNGYTLGALVIGDLASNIGYGLHQYHKLFVKRELRNIATTFWISDNQLSNFGFFFPVKRDINLANNSRYKLSENSNIEGQIELRLNKFLGTSFASGIAYRFKKGNFDLSSRLKYFQSDFNFGYKSSRPEYRGRSSYVGEQIYPLKNYFRPYSQWAGYTNYQGQDLLGLELELHWERHLFNNVNFYSDLDINIIRDVNTWEDYTIPLYNIGFNLTFLKELKGTVTLTNKHMNLDSFYQTFQASKTPFLSGSIKLNIDNLRFRHSGKS